jgi:hypothetical protein
MAVTVTKTTITTINTDQTFTANAATSTTANEAEVFTVTPTKSSGKSAIVFGNATGHGAYTYSIAAGDLWAGAAITGSVAAAALEVLEYDSAKVLQDDGTIAITLTPATGKVLLTDHAAKIYHLELL